MEAVRRILRTRARRRIASALAFVVAPVVSTGVALAACDLQVASFVVAAWAMVFGALAFANSIWHPFAPRPSLAVTLHVRETGEELEHVVRDRGRPIRPLDAEAIVRTEIEVARETIEPPPEKKRPRSPLDFAPPPPLVPTHESYNKSMKRFTEDVQEYVEDLASWIAEWNQQRWPAASLVEAHVRVKNDGDAQADQIRVRLELPAGLEPVESRPCVPPPPERPRFERRRLLDVRPEFFAREGLELDTPHPPFGALTGPQLVRERGRRFLEFSLASLTHGLAESSAGAVRLVPDKPGRYELPWTAHAANLSEEVRGTITLEVIADREDGSPLASLADLLASDDVPIDEDCPWSPEGD